MLSVEGLSATAISELHHYLAYLRRREAAPSTLPLSALPLDIQSRITEFLPGSDLLRLSQTSKSLREASLLSIKSLGERYFKGIVVAGHCFSLTAQTRGLCGAFARFLSAFGFSPHPLMAGAQPDEVQLAVADDQPHSFTVPLGFAVSREAEVFLDLAAEIHFGPEVIRSVVGVIDDLANLHVDRAMAEASDAGFGLAFGPLSGVLSRDGKYFDRFHTFATGAFIRDFLASATADTVGLRLGIFFSQGRVAFFRLAEEDGDWESTGFVYEMNKSQNFLYPCLMFSRVSQAEDVFFQLRAISDRPPFFPHVNAEALDYDNNWLPFEDDTLDILRQEDLPDAEVRGEGRRAAVVAMPAELGDVFAENEALLRQLQQLRERYAQQLARD